MREWEMSVNGARAEVDLLAGERNALQSIADNDGDQIDDAASVVDSVTNTGLLRLV